MAKPWQSGQSPAASSVYAGIPAIRDFKPANVIVGDDGRVRVLDFGLAHFFGLGGEEGDLKALPSAAEISDVLLTQTGAVLGTPAYMAAEQFAGGRGDAKTDQFSFCTALYEALYGQRPFAGDRLDALVSFELQMRSETDAIGIDFDSVPVMIDFAAEQTLRLTPNMEQGGATRPPIRRGEDGSVQTCAALGPGTLIEIAALEPSSP